MKKILLLAILVLSGFFSYGSASGLSLVACTTEYDPVCAQPQSNCFGALCDLPQGKTFGNKCEAERAGAIILYEGACDTEPKVCPEVAPPVCKGAGGYKIIGYSEVNGCKIPKFQCNEEPKICPVAAPPVCKGAWGYKIIGYSEVNGCKIPKFQCNEEPKICPVAAPPVCKGAWGYKIIGYSEVNGCKIPKFQCNEEPKICPVFNLIAPEPGCEYIYKKDSVGCDVPHLICDNNKVCTTEYDPVCAQPQSSCVGNLCDPAQPKTFGNSCSAKAAGAEVLYKGVCKTEPKVCPVADEPNCPYGYKKTGSIWVNGCEEIQYQCNEKPKICTKEYAPVCAQPESSCVGNLCDPAQPKTYGNTCEAEAAGAEILYKGICEIEPKICTKEYDPVCGKLQNNCKKIGTGTVCTQVYSFPQTFGNMCELKKAGATFISEGLCETLDSGNKPICTTDAKRCDDGSYVSRIGPNCEFAKCPVPKKLPTRITNKADTALNSYSNRLQSLNTSNTKKLVTINKLIAKLSIMRSNDNSENMELLIEYLIEKLKETKEDFE